MLAPDRAEILVLSVGVHPGSVPLPGGRGGAGYRKVSADASPGSGRPRFTAGTSDPRVWVPSRMRNELGWEWLQEQSASLEGLPFPDPLWAGPLSPPACGPHPPVPPGAPPGLTRTSPSGTALSYCPATAMVEPALLAGGARRSCSEGL